MLSLLDHKLIVVIRLVEALVAFRTTSTSIHYTAGQTESGEVAFYNSYVP